MILMRFYNNSGMKGEREKRINNGECRKRAQIDRTFFSFAAFLCLEERKKREGKFILKLSLLSL